MKIMTTVNFLILILEMTLLSYHITYYIFYTIISIALYLTWQLGDLKSHNLIVLSSDLTWQFGDLKSHNLIVLSSDPDKKLSSIGDILKLTTLLERIHIKTHGSTTVRTCSVL